MRIAVALALAAAVAFGSVAGRVQGSGPSAVSLVGNVNFVSSSTGWVEVSTSAGYGRYCYETLSPPPACDRASTSLYGTSDGGHTWRRMLRFSSRPLASQNLLPSAWMQPGIGGYGFVLAWVPGAYGSHGRGTLYRTGNDRRSWMRLPLPFQLGYVSDTDVTAVRGHNLWVLAHLGAAAGSEAVSVYRTRDAGTHWRKVACADFGQVSGPGRCRLRSGIGVGGHKDDIAFADARTGVIANNNNSGIPFLTVTHDGGTHWRMERTPFPRGVPPSTPKTGVASYVTLYKAQFFGRSGVLPASVIVCRGQRVNGHTKDVCMDRFYALVSHDGGRTWPVTRSFPAMSRLETDTLNWQVESRRVWHASARTHLWSTRDGGGHWTTVTMRVPHGFRILRLDFVSSASGWAIAGQVDVADGVARATELVRTDDAGKTWRVAPLSRHMREYRHSGAPL